VPHVQVTSWAGFDSRAVPARDRIPLWEDAIARFLVPLQLDVPGSPVVGAIEGRNVDFVTLCRLHASAHYGVRTREAASGVGAGHVKVALALRGCVTVSQFGRSVRLRPGDCAIYDTSDEYRVGSSAPFGVLIALMPRDALHTTQGALTSACAVPMPCDAGAIIRDSVLTVARSADGAGELVATLESAIARARPRRSHGNVPDDVLRDRLRSMVESHLADGRLGPDYLAGTLGVSRRRLYQLGEDELGGVAGYIRDRRMARGRDLLRSADRRWARIGDIALACGYPDPAHFSRVFSRAHGVNPREYRRRSMPLPGAGVPSA